MWDVLSSIRYGLTNHHHSSKRFLTYLIISHQSKVPPNIPNAFKNVCCLYKRD